MELWQLRFLGVLLKQLQLGRPQNLMLLTKAHSLWARAPDLLQHRQDLKASSLIGKLLNQEEELMDQVHLQHRPPRQVVIKMPSNRGPVSGREG